MASLACSSRSIRPSGPFHCLHICRYYSESASIHRTSIALPPPRLDYRAISKNIVYKATNAINRKAPLPADTIQSVARAYAEQKTISKILNARRNARSVVGERMRRSAEANDSEEKNAALEEAKKLKHEILELESKMDALDKQLLTLGLAIPNDTHPSSPLGPESSAVVLSSHGPKPLPFDPHRDHVSIAQKLGLIDLESGAMVTGTSWYYLTNEAALLELALTNYAMSIAAKYGFTPVTTPDVVRSDIASRCGFQPRDTSANPPASQLYHIERSTSASGLVLTGTAEIPLAGMFGNKIFPVGSLPSKVVGLGRAFRAEAGAHGVDTRGLYRVHQFTKLELFAVTEEGASEEMMQEMLRVQVAILDGLGFPFRVLDMPTEELGASAYRKFDIEAWMPGRGKWGEISSLSNCTDYQSRRLHIRYRPQPSTGTAPPTPSSSYATASIPFTHTLNGTAAAVPRLIIALIENGARFAEDGEITGLNLPEILRPFWVGNGSNERNIVHWV